MLENGTEEAVAVPVVELVEVLLALDELASDSAGEDVGSSAVTVEVTRSCEDAEVDTEIVETARMVSADEEEGALRLRMADEDMLAELEVATLEGDVAVGSTLASLAFGLASSVGAAPRRGLATTEESTCAGLT